MQPLSRRNFTCDACWPTALAQSLEQVRMPGGSLCICCGLLRVVTERMVVVVCMHMLFCTCCPQGVVNMINAAKQSGGVKHLVLVSSMLTDPANRSGQLHTCTEQLLLCLRLRQHSPNLRSVGVFGL
jgi:hypothetical protein